MDEEKTGEISIKVAPEPPPEAVEGRAGSRDL